jgi:hypothetical protein
MYYLVKAGSSSKLCHGLEIPRVVCFGGSGSKYEAQTQQLTKALLTFLNANRHLVAAVWFPFSMTVAASWSSSRSIVDFVDGIRCIWAVATGTTESVVEEGSRNT